MNNTKRSKMLSTFEEAILLAVHDEPLNGWSIMKKINFFTEKGHEFSFGSLYPALIRLDEAELLNAVKDTDKKNPKFIYSITKKGKEELEKIRKFRENLAELANNSYEEEKAICYAT